MMGNNIGGASNTLLGRANGYNTIQKIMESGPEPHKAK